MHNSYFINYFGNLRAITSKRKQRFCDILLQDTEKKIGFVDVGAGLELKAEWRLLPEKMVDKIDFEVNSDSENHFAAISNKKGKALFHQARNPRNSSLHNINMTFIKRFSRRGMIQKEALEIETDTLDHLLESKADLVDILDINVEGHDFQVLHGSEKLLNDRLIKCIKVEFELTEVWENQGYFSDIDALIRQHGFELARLDVHNEKPTSVRHIAPIFQKGEPIWGKAFFVPSLKRWHDATDNLDADEIETELKKAIAVYTVLDIPGRSFDLIDEFAGKTNNPASWKDMKHKIEAVYRYAWFDRIIFGLLLPVKSAIKRVLK